ncbi:pectinesterase-like [Abrus precatorius]|uniref:Pectinesterase n=1 Tax=Abrus precatorius TaxID=3816 RepID=A0A8B8L4N3_ABRPR|nr:pectinesterase-like [Abrus precatorius]XP_027353227.1 pectinesterase-like [Abrus precatorius]
MSGKVIISAVSLILVVGVALGVVVAVNKKSEDPEIQSQQKSVRVICQDTEDQKLCHDTLSSVKGVNATDPKAYIAAAVKATTDSVIKAFNMSDRLTTEYGKDDSTKMALDDCKDLLQSAIESLQLSTDLVHNNDVQNIHLQSADFRNWLSAVISYQQACMDGFDRGTDGEKKIKEQLNEQGLDHVQKITAITLDIVTDLSKILEQFGLKLDLKPASRRLLGSEADEEGYPTWFPAADRKLLAQLQGKGWRSRVKPNVVVAKDGSGQFKTIAEAIASYPKGFSGPRYVIYVKAGVYDEYITVPKQAVNVLMYGDGPLKTIVTGHKSFAGGITTMQTATFANTATGFIAKAMTFENTAGPDGHQAVALRNQGDASAFVGCHILGYQDTLYAQANRQFYRNCVISGTIDFIFGTSPVIIQHSVIIVRKPNDNQFNTVTADGTKTKKMNTGIVIQDCQIVPEAALFPVRFQIKSYLGRPWKELSTTVVMESTIGDFIHPDGWFPWAGNAFLDTLYYAEYNNDGPGANVSGRVKWKGYRGLISRAEAEQFTAGKFLQAGPGSGVDWIKSLHVPHALGFVKA